MRCTTCDVIALADDESLEALVRRQADQLERLGNRLLDTAIELNATRDELGNALTTIARQNQRLAELNRRLGRVAS